MRPSLLPEPTALKSLMQSFAALDAMLSPEWEYRYFSFDSAWAPNEAMGSIRNGSGDDVFVLFNQSGCFLKGFSHEFYQEDLSPDKFYKDVPLAFLEASKEPAFTPSNVSFCAWYQNETGEWAQSVDDEKLNSDIFFLLQDLNGSPESYVAFASDYFEVELEIATVRTVLQKKPISRELALSFNTLIDYNMLSKELSSIGYQ